MTSRSVDIGGPVYIGGLDRSGKTTMATFLGSLPELAIPGVGSNMWTFFADRYGDLSNRSNLDSCIAAMMSYKHVRYLEPDEADIRRRFADGPPTYARLFAAVLEQFAEREGKPRWGAQTGLIERYADRIVDAFPDVRIIHMLRDPRDRYHASISRWPDGKGRAGGAVARWNYSTALAERHLKRYPESYLVVRFEDLITQTETTLRRACEFVGVPYRSDILDRGATETARGGVGSRQEAGGTTHPTDLRIELSADHIGLHRTGVAAAEIAFIDLFAGPRMRRWNYETERAPGPADIGFWAGTCPGQLVRGWAWRLVEEGQMRLPRIVPRRPGARMIVGPDWKPKQR